MSKSKYSGAGYDAIRGITDLPIKSRRALAIGRDGNRIKPRRMHLETGRLDQLRAEYRDTNVIPNPFNKGAYHFIVAALLALGLNRKHKLATVQEKFRELMSDPATKNDEGKTLWQRFRNKEPKGSEETSLDWADRFEQNIRVLQRFGGMTPYGLKLCEVGSKVCRFKGLVIDLLKDGSGEVYVRLNSDANRPVNELKKRGNVQPERKVQRKPRAAKPKTVAATQSTPAAQVEPAAASTPAAESTDASAPTDAPAAAATQEAAPAV